MSGGDLSGLGSCEGPNWGQKNISVKFITVEKLSKDQLKGLLRK